MANYATVGSNMIEKARDFYDGLLGTVGMQKRFDHPSGGRIYGGENGKFGVLPPHDENDASVGNGTMIGFGAKDRAGVDAFHAKALELGGQCEGEPGERAGGPAYFAYVRDLDGNKLCAYTFNPPA
jgi:catechol 2,3-dioxygenase-like lactoylglutathione lyase family enzyme